MKKFRFLAFAAAGMLLAACSTNDTIADGGQDATKEGTGYLSVTINLPTTPATRAANDNYDDGLASEYAVNDAKLLLFHLSDEDKAAGKGEDAATFFQAAILDLPDRVDETQDDNITSSYLSVATVNNSYTSGLYALVLINSTNLFDIGQSTFKTGGEENFKLVSGETKISDLQNIISNIPFYGEKTGFFMTNAVLCSVKGGTATPGAANPSASKLSVLAQLEDNCIKESPKEAKQHPAGSVFVERAVAKATLRLGDNAGTDLGITSVEWTLNNTEPTSYVVRNMFGFDESGKSVVDDYMAYSSENFNPANYRFAGNVAIGKTPIQPVVDYYRTYWCVDPQYSVKAKLSNKVNYTSTDKPQYCYENTFNVENQTYHNTTRAIIRATTNNTTFYTINGSDDKCTLEQAQAEMQKTFMNDAAVVNLFKNNLKPNGEQYDITPDCFVWAYTFNEKTGVYSIDGANVKLADKVTGDNTHFVENAFATDVESAFKTAAVTANTYTEVLQYTNGIMYYEARFQHFADNANRGTDSDLAPWNTWEDKAGKPAPAPGNNITKAYPGNAEINYLGRYGMVRNNWYDVVITKFEKIGSPVDPSIPVNPNPDDPDDPGIPDIPDDNLNSKYISVKVNVLSWAKRVQGWSF